MPSLLRIVGFLGLGPATVTVVPDLVRPIQNVLGLEGEPLGRLVTVLVISVALGYGGLFYALARADRANQRVSRLVRALSAAQIELVRSGGPLGGILVCIPAFDEADNLPGVIAEVPSIVAGRADFVVGSRRMGSSDSESRAREAGISIYTRLINLLGGTQISDIANGYRAMRASRLSEISFTEDQFHNPELLLGASRAGLRVLDVPVTIRRRASGQSKKGTNLRYGLGFLRVIV